MQLIAKVIATVGFLGYVPVAPGTVGSLVGWLVGLVLLAIGAGPLTVHPAVLALGTWTGLAVCFGLGVAASQICLLYTSPSPRD